MDGHSYFFLKIQISLTRVSQKEGCPQMIFSSTELTTPLEIFSRSEPVYIDHYLVKSIATIVFL